MSKIDKITTFHDVHDNFAFTLARIQSKYFKSLNYTIHEKCPLRIDIYGGIENFLDEVKIRFRLDA